MLTGFFGERKRFADGLAIAPFALFAAFSMTVPYVLVAWLLGPEFPSLLGGLIGLAIVMFASSRGFLMPKKTWDFPARARWPRHWMGTISPEDEADVAERRMSIWLAWTPYVVVAVLLVMTRTIDPITTFLTSGWRVLAVTDILGVTGVSQGLGKPNSELADVAVGPGSAGLTRGGAPADGREQTDMIPDPGKTPDGRGDAS